MGKSSSSFADGAHSSEDEAHDHQTRKLEWRCRRGMKELDLLLMRYLRGRLALAASAEREAFAEFLELPDPLIARYLVAGDVPEDPRLAAVCRELLRSN